MSRPIVLVFLAVVLVATSQIEWKHQLAGEMDTNSGDSKKQISALTRAEVVKEKIILSQEKSIQKLNELVQSLRLQLLQCQSGINISSGDQSSIPEEYHSEMEGHDTLKG